MGEKKEKKKKKSIATKTLIYLIIATAVAAVLIMFSYGKIQFRSLSRESVSLLGSFEETYKFMKDKETDTSKQVENDICVSARLTASAVRTGGDDIGPCRYHNGWIIKKNSNAAPTAIPKSNINT
jgi:flagellar basal body-associated protein FliL